MIYLRAAIVPAVVLGVAVVMLVAELRSWRASKGAALPEHDRDFRWRRFRRRMQAGGMLAVVGVLMFLGAPAFMRQNLSVHVSTGIWGTVFVLLFWVLLLALMDALASLQRNQQLKQELSVERAKLQAEIRRYQQAESADNASTPEKVPEPDADSK